MKTLQIVAVVLGMAATAAANVTVQWVDQAAEAGRGRGVALNTAGGLVVAGTRSLTGIGPAPTVWVYSTGGSLLFSGTMAGAPGEGRAVAAVAGGDAVAGGAALLNGANGTDAWLAELTPLGATVWFSTFHGPAMGDNSIDGIAFDPPSGNVAVTGRTTLTLAQGADLWVALVNPAGALIGQYVWADPLNQDDAGQAVTVDALGNIYVAGYVTKVMAQGKDVWVGKFSPTTPALTLQWSITLNGVGSSTDYGTGIALDSLGNLIVTGSVVGPQGTTDILVADIANGSTVASDGSVLWARTIDGGEQDNDEAHAVVVAQGFAYVAGAVDRFGGGFLNAWLAKFDAGGATVYEHDQDGSASDDDRAFGVAVDPLGTIYLTGQLTSSLSGPVMFTERLRDSALIVPSSSAANQTGRPAPNPFRPGHGGPQDAAGITFAPLTGGSVVRIYTLAGSLVTELRDDDQDGIIFWNAKTPSGMNVVSGVYVYLVTSPAGAVSRGKVVIIR